MARLQILELPEGASDDRPPFVLVIDQHQPLRYVLGADQEPQTVDEFAGVAEQIGARGILVFQETIEIPGNDVPLDPDGYPLKFRIEPDFETFREQVQDEIRKTQGELRQAINDDGIAESSGPKCQYCGANCSDGRSWDGGDLYACPSCADWRAKLNHYRADLIDALGMDRLRGWDDIRNAAAGLRKERDTQAETLERVRNLPEQPQVMDAQHPDSSSYLHGYGVAIREAKRASNNPRTE